MQNCTTILGIIDMRQRGISYDDCRSRYKVGCNTITLIMNRFKESGKDLDTLKQMPAEEVENLSFPPENLRRKDDSIMPDYQAVYDRLTVPGSKVNILAQQYRNSGILSTDVPDVDTGIDWLGYLV